jgi:hypothetical protein
LHAAGTGATRPQRRGFFRVKITLKGVYSDKVLRAYKTFLGPPYILQIQMLDLAVSEP